jgi:signal transduction histidine kinase/DNA-binding response OmpR family regulator
MRSWRGTMLLAGLTGHVMAGRLLRPLTQLREATSAITPEDLTRRVDVSNADNDVAQLGRTFNQMLDRLEAGIVDQRQFLDDAAHELRTPLTIIRGNLELVTADDPEDVAATRDMVLDETDRMQRLVDDLLLLAKAQRPDFVRPEPVDVAAFAEELLDRVHLLGERRWARAGSATGVVRADRQRLQQAAVQLAANAVKFSEPGDSVTVGLSWSQPSAEVRARVPRATERYLVVSVQDTGAGLEPDQAERVLERFDRGGDNASNVEGSGLGPAIVMAIAEAHQGTVTLDSQVGIGSTFRCGFPATRCDAGAMAYILIAEDEQRIAGFMEKGLRAAGYRTHVVADGVTALECASSGDYDLMVCWTSGCPGWTASPCCGCCAPWTTTCPSSCAPPGTPRRTPSRGWRAGRTTTLPSRSSSRSCWARVRTRLRPRPGTTVSTILSQGSLSLDLTTRIAVVDGREVELSAREFAMARELLEHPGQVLSREQLLSRVWGYDFDGASNVVDVYIRYLRTKLGVDRFVTVRGVGYRLATE